MESYLEAPSINKGDGLLGSVPEYFYKMELIDRLWGRPATPVKKNCTA